MIQEMEERSMTQGFRASDWKEDNAITESGDSSRNDREGRKMKKFI